tara:strand:- start:96 stop:305 length:210 start_codon:yes stop_codon:yes gene_type:complete
VYDLSRVVPYDYPTPSDEYDETLVYVQQKFNNTTLDVIDTIDSNGITKWSAEEVKEDKKMRRSIKYGIT